jgi:hypothetical protein
VTGGQETTRFPVRSALFKQRTGGLVIRWVTTSEYPLLNVFAPVSVLSDQRVETKPWFLSRVMCVGKTCFYPGDDGCDGMKAVRTLSL